MVSNQYLRARLTTGLVALAVTVAGCSFMRSSDNEDAGAAPVASSQAPAASDAVTQDLSGDLTATEAAVASGDAGPAQAAPAATPGDVINPSAPKSYTVQRGDTLWDISSMFLRDPWLWPEVWYVNPQVANPHLIYPGDVLALAYGANGQPQIRLERGGAARLEPRLRSNPLDGAIPTIPYSAIQAFLTRPSVLSKEQIKGAPHVLAFREGHMIGGAGTEIYVRNLKAEPNSRFSVMRVGDELVDPDDGAVLGYQGIYTATAMVVRQGEPSKAALTDSARETVEGDRLFSADNEVPLNFMIRGPSKDVEGRIISVIDGVYSIGQYRIVVINRGIRHGVDVGNVLAIDQAGPVVRDQARGAMSRTSSFSTFSSFAEEVKLPDERAGTLLVFKAFDRMSYGLVVGASSAIHIGDVVRNP
jgi:LysM repeat protein